MNRSLLRISLLLVLLTSLVGLPAGPAAAAPPAVTGLTTNGRVDPLGIPGDTPVLGWVSTSADRGVTQSAYQIQVGSSPGASNVWNSGRVTSDRQVNVAYGGPALAAGTRYHWRVRVWDQTGTVSAWSASSWFETGLLSAADWGAAAWIGKPAPSYVTWTDYTTAVTFDLNAVAFGTFLRAGDLNNAYMWQLNVGPTAADVPRLRPHLLAGGAYTVLGEVDLRPFGFTRAGLLDGPHTVTYELAGDTVRTTLDDVLVDTRTVTGRGSGRVGVRTHGDESATVTALRVTRPDGTVLAEPDFRSNPFDAGALDGRRLTVSGTVSSLLITTAEHEPLLRTRFTTTPGKTIRSARVYASAHGVYELSINGRKVGDQFLAPGYTEYAKRIQSQTYDVTGLVTAGANGFGAALGDGWWAGKVGLAGKGGYGDDLALVARLRITYTDGTVQWVDTNPGWRWTPGPFAATDNQLGETYRAQHLPAGWNTAPYDDATWQAVVVRPSDTARLSPQPDEPVRQTAVLDTVRVTSPAAGVNIYDLGQNMVGVARLTITGRAGDTVRLRHAEVLNRDGTMYTANLRAAAATDYYTFATGGTVTYQPTFTQHGFRYLEVSGLAALPPAADVKGVVWGSDLPRIGTLQTSSALLDQLHGNVAWGARGNFLSIPTDTPARDERLGWTGDINIFAPTAAYLSDTRAFLGKWMLDVRDEQKANGSIPAVAPATGGAFEESGVGWEDAIITVPYSLWHGFGDLKAVQENYPAMKRFFDYARASAGADNLETGRTTFFTADWLHLDDPSHQGVLGTAIWAQDVRMMAEMARATGRTAEAADYDALFQSVRQAFTAAYVADDGTVLGGSQTGYALALGKGLISDPVKERRAGEKFVAKLAQTDNHLRTGFIGTPWLLPALSRIGRDDLAYRMLLKEDYPSWGYEIRNGATTIWERWNSIQPDGSFGPVDMNSFNHYAYGAVADWMHQNIAGIRAAEPGYRRSVIAPRPGGGLTSGQGTLRTVYGTLSSTWQQAADGLTLGVTVPVNTTAEVRIPSDAAYLVTEGGAALPGRAGIRAVRYDEADSTTVVTVGSGTYAFKAAAVTVPPAETTTDAVDLGDAGSEAAHAVTGSASSGTSVEGGLTRRYSHNLYPGSWFSAQVTVPAGRPFRLRLRETWASAGVKDYDVQVGDTPVRRVHLTRYAGGQGTTSHEILVDEPAALANDGRVTVRFTYPSGNPPGVYYDASLADLWVLPV